MAQKIRINYFVLFQTKSAFHSDSYTILCIFWIKFCLKQFPLTICDLKGEHQVQYKSEPNIISGEIGHTYDVGRYVLLLEFNIRENWCENTSYKAQNKHTDDGRQSAAAILLFYLIHLLSLLKIMSNTKCANCKEKQPILLLLINERDQRIVLALNTAWQKRQKWHLS